MRKFKKGYIVLMCIMLMFTFTACKKDNEAVSILKESSAEFSKAKSIRTSIDIDALYEKVNNSTGIKMFFELENTSDPLAGHAVGFSLFDIGGRKSGGVIEIFQVVEDGETYTYSRVNDTWTKEKAELSESDHGIKSEFLDPDKKPKKFTLKENLVTIREKECYELSGFMTGKDVMNIFDIRTVNNLADMETPDTDKIGKSQIPFIINVEKESLLPSRIYIDMTDALNDIYNEMDENSSVSKFTITVDYEDYDNISEITVPDEVKQEAK